ncbi:hypothetical protein F2Q69_00022393 [Brassica cretica]|uniref:Uncharacterized protein n=1 Tax=Brassica cretica TaxID=69181 RepID=A0A8S9QTC8_BRACR|nr:hypothetical protein F2Q69_00022393 [Brassica cretica]
MAGSAYRKFSFSRGKGAVPGTGPRVLRSKEPAYLLAGTQRPVYMPSSTRSNKETKLLFSPDPASLERSIRKEACSSSIDNNTCSSLDFFQPPSTQALAPSTDTRSQPSTDTRSQPSTEDTHLPSPAIFHPTSIDT